MARTRPHVFAQIAITLLFLGCLTAPGSAAGSSSGDTLVHPSGDDDAYILSNEHAFFSTNARIADVESLRERLDGDFLWVRRDRKEFVIRDAGTMEEAQRLFNPLNQLDPEREALQVKQERLGLEESALDDEEERLEEELEAWDEHEERDVADSVRMTLERRRAEVDSKMLALVVRERELDAVERVLDDRSVAIELKAEAALWKLVDQALANGLGRAVRSK